MTLVGRVNQEPVTNRPGPKCGLGRLADVLKQQGANKEFDGLVELIEAVRSGRAASPFTSSRSWTAVSVHQILLEEGHSLSLLTVQRHIAKRCACGW